MGKWQLFIAEKVVRKCHIADFFLDSCQGFTYWSCALWGHILDVFFCFALFFMVSGTILFARKGASSLPTE